MRFEPSDEFKGVFRVSPEQEMQTIKVAQAFYRVFETPEGKLVLQHLNLFTDRLVPIEHLPMGAIHKEGQRALFHEILFQITAGERSVHGSKT